MTPDAAIVAVSTWTAWLLGGYLVLRAVATALAKRRGTARALGLAITVGLVTTGGVAAAGQSGSSHHPHPPTVSVDWPSSDPGAAPPSVRVEPGDCLWTIAARRLPHATAGRVAAVWPRWWRTNRRVIGADPDLVRPGERLRPPTPKRSHS